MVVAESPFFGCEILFFWLSSFFGCGIVFFGCGIVLFWLRKRLFLVAEACLILVAESPKFGCGSVEISFRNRNLFLVSAPLANQEVMFKLLETDRAPNPMMVCSSKKTPSTRIPDGFASLPPFKINTAQNHGASLEPYNEAA